MRSPLGSECSCPRLCLLCFYNNPGSVESQRGHNTRARFYSGKSSGVVDLGEPQGKRGKATVLVFSKIWEGKGKGERNEEALNEGELFIGIIFSLVLPDTLFQKIEHAEYILDYS